MIVLTNMYLAKLAVFLSLCYNLANGFWPRLGHRGGLNFLRKEINATAGSFNFDPIDKKWTKQPVNHFDPIDIKQIKQPVDHFDPYEKREWNMTYFERTDLWRPNGPVFLMMEEDIVYKLNVFHSGMMYDLAKETHGAIFVSEHRYTGGSRPFIHYTLENLMYLSSRQALADNARLIEKIKHSKSFSSSKIVLIGGSYGGNLAVWMKLLYPELVDAVIASSAPVLAKADFFEYLEILSDVYHQHGTTGCYDNVKEYFIHIRKSFTTAEGIKRLKKEMHICDETDMTKIINQQFFLYSQASFFMFTAEKGLDNIKKLCNDLENKNFHLISSNDTRADKWNQRIDFDICFEFDLDEYIEFTKTYPSDIAHLYQTCTEFGYFRTSNSKKQIFTVNVDKKYFFYICKYAFGPDFGEERLNQGVQHTNEMYGGLKPNVTNVVFVNGELDPWHRLSVLEDLSSDAPAKVVPYSSHCEVLSDGKPNDHEELKEARIFIKNLIKKWIGAGEFSNIH